MIISPKYKIGFQKRFSNKNLAFVRLKPEYKNFQNWIDKSIPVIDYDNVPRKGYKLYGVTQRSSDYFGDGRNMIYIEHPDGWIFEIDVYNFIQITAYFNLIDQVIDGECIISFRNQSIVLLPLGSKEYKEAIKSTEILNKVFDQSTLSIGDLVQMKDKSQYIYIGEYKKINIREENKEGGHIGYGHLGPIHKVEITPSSKATHNFICWWKHSDKKTLIDFFDKSISLDKISSIIQKNKFSVEKIKDAISKLEDFKPSFFINEFTIESNGGMGHINKIKKNNYTITKESNKIEGCFVIKSVGMVDKKIEFKNK